MKKNIYAISGNNNALSGFFRAHKPTTGNFKDAGYFTNGMTWHDLSRGMRNANLNLHLDVSEKRGFSPQIIHFNSVFHYRPSTLGYPYFWKHPFVFVCVFTMVFSEWEKIGLQFHQQKTAGFLVVEISSLYIGLYTLPPITMACDSVNSVCISNSSYLSICFAIFHWTMIVGERVIPNDWMAKIVLQYLQLIRTWDNLGWSNLWKGCALGELAKMVKT